MLGETILSEQNRKAWVDHLNQKVLPLVHTAYQEIHPGVTIPEIVVGDLPGAASEKELTVYTNSNVYPVGGIKFKEVSQVIIPLETLVGQIELYKKSQTRAEIAQESYALSTLPKAIDRTQFKFESDIAIALVSLYTHISCEYQRENQDEILAHSQQVHDVFINLRQDQLRKSLNLQ